jgi:hypothetical protein
LASFHSTVKAASLPDWAALSTAANSSPTTEPSIGTLAPSCSKSPPLSAAEPALTVRPASTTASPGATTPAPNRREPRNRYTHPPRRPLPDANPGAGHWPGTRHPVTIGPSSSRISGSPGFCIATLHLVQSGPVFADPSGRRRRIMRRMGLGSAAALVVCLGAVVVAIAGGPQAPFAKWAAPRSPAAATSNHDRAAQGRDPGGSTVSPLPPAPQPGVVPSPSPSSPPSPGQSTSGSPSATSSSSSPVSTNPANRTPPGHTRSPGPRKSSHGA